MADVTDKNILATMALYMDSPTLINVCSSNKDFYAKVCDNRDFWFRKLNMDYPNVSNYYTMNNLSLKNPKRKYMEVFKKEGELVEEYAIFYANLLSSVGVEIAPKNFKIGGVKEIENILYLLIKNFKKLLAAKLTEIRKNYPRGEVIIRQADKDNFLRKGEPEALAEEAINMTAQHVNIPEPLKERLRYFITSAYISKNEASVYDIYKFL